MMMHEPWLARSGIWTGKCTEKDPGLHCDSRQAGAGTCAGVSTNFVPGPAGAWPRFDRGMSFLKLHFTRKPRPSPGTQGPGHQLIRALLSMMIIESFGDCYRTIWCRIPAKNKIWCQANDLNLAGWLPLAGKLSECNQKNYFTEN